jgi:hypothetical protein
MRLITARLHRVLDFVTVGGFALAPSLLGLVGFAATLAYLLAAVHFTLTLLTHFPGSSTRPVPFALHGVIEGVVGVALLLLPWLAGWTGTARTFYLVAGLVILVVWAASAYRPATSSAAI